MNSEITLESVTLYCREGSTDKVYQVRIEPAGNLYTVAFAYGRRGATLQTGTKTPAPVAYTTAKEIYDRVIKEKLAKGYTPGPDGTPYQHGALENAVPGILPQLLNPVEEQQVDHLLNDSLHCAQEKYDGRRILVQKIGTDIRGINRKGLVTGLPQTVIEAAQAVPGDYVLDGECVGDVLFVFDALEIAGLDLRKEAYQKRLVALINLLALGMQRHIRLAETSFTPGQKRDLFTWLKRHRKEGIVFKRLDAPYVPGRPASGGSALKHKFYATASAVVARVNPQRSVELRLLNCLGWVPVGNVTIPPNHTVPAVGTVVEVRYLYAFPESKCLYQPTYLGQRTDIEQHECILSQLKFKTADE